jgi:hypothetical protein
VFDGTPLPVPTYCFKCSEIELDKLKFLLYAVVTVAQETKINAPCSRLKPSIQHWRVFGTYSQKSVENRRGKTDIIRLSVDGSMSGEA